jgi:hypothetical protein
MIKFALHTFPGDRILPQIEINGRVERNDRIFSIEYRLQGDLNSVSIDPRRIPPSRQPELWGATCFEFFIGVVGDPSYWEFNLSPSGDWNVFHLDDYRQGLQDETAFTALPMEIDRQDNLLVLKLSCDLSKIISTIDLGLEVAITAVIKSSQNEMSYWALTHAGTEADFHLRDSFIIKI